MDWSQLQPTTLSTPDSLVVSLERLILAKDLQPGEKLPPERALAGLLGVSRSSLRDALRALEVRGMLRRQPGLGTIVTDPGVSFRGNHLAAGLDASTVGLQEIMDVRACIEPPIAARAASRASAVEIVQLRDLISEMNADLSPADFANLDRIFHRAIAQYANNPLLLRLHDRVNDMIEPSRDELYLTSGRQRSSIIEHRQIVLAIAAHDSEAASRAAAIHVESIQARIIRSHTFARDSRTSSSVELVHDA